MYFPVKTDTVSANVLISSHGSKASTSRDFNPANFSVTAPNTLALQKIVKCVPSLITIPRLFDNVTTENNRFKIKNGDDVQSVVIPPGKYSIFTLIEYLNSIQSYMKVQLHPDVRLSFTETSTPVFISCEDVDTSRLLGLSVPDGGFVRVVDVVSVQPALTGPTVVLVVIDGVIGGNLIDCQDGNIYEVLAEVPMTGVGFGENVIFRSSDIFTHDIDYETPRDYSQMRVRLTDTSHKQLELPPSAKVDIVMKVFHVDNSRV